MSKSRYVSMKDDSFKAVIGFILLLLFIFAISSFFVNDSNNNNSNTGGVGEDNNRNLITFTIGDGTLHAESGMTWSQLLIDPKYNTGFDQNGEYITISTGAHIQYLYTQNGAGVKLSDTILEGGVYYFSTVCPDRDLSVLDFYLVGFINGADYGSAYDYETIGDYRFVDGKLVVTFDAADNYVFVKTGDNANWFMASAYCTDTTVTLANTNKGTTEKLYVPGGVEITFTLVINEDDTLTLSYTAATSDPDTGEDDNPNIITFTIGDDTLQAERGMTWSQWLIDHKDNIGFDQNGEYITITTGAHILYLCMEDGTLVKPSDVILEDGVYYFSTLRPDPDTGEDDNPNLITFTVGNDTLQAERGMTWLDWLVTSYNTTYFSIERNYIGYYDFQVFLYKFLFNPSGNVVSVFDTIIENAVYTFLDQSNVDLSSPGGGSNAKTYISFKVGSGTFIAEEGMTWEEWLSDSRYNIGGFVTDGDFVYTSDSFDFCLSDYDEIAISVRDKINHDGAYQFLMDPVFSGSEDNTSDPNIITFTIERTTLQAESGMTWGEWINSGYNPGVFALNHGLNGLVCLGAGLEYAVFTPDGIGVEENDVIVSDVIYKTYDISGLFPTPDPDPDTGGDGEDDNSILIIFTVGRTNLLAESGMTWSQLLADPKYNKGFDQTGEYITISTGAHIQYLCEEDGTRVKSSDEILEGGVYHFLTV